MEPIGKIVDWESEQIPNFFHIALSSAFKHMKSAPRPVKEVALRDGFDARGVAGSKEHQRVPSLRLLRERNTSVEPTVSRGV